MNALQAARIAVLVVEDNREMLQDLCRGLRVRGYDAEGVTTGREALTRLQYSDFAAVVADAGVVRTYDLDLIHEVQSLEGFRPWAVYIGMPDPSAPRWCSQSGVFCVLMKDEPTKGLLRSVEEVCRAVSWTSRARCA